MLYALKIAARYLTASKAQTALLVFGVAIGVFIFIFMSALIGGSDDSDSDECDQGRTMATESELVPLEGAALSPDSIESMLPEQLCSQSPLCYARHPNLAIGYDLIRSRKLVSF